MVASRGLMHKSPNTSRKTCNYIEALLHKRLTQPNLPDDRRWRYPDGECDETIVVELKLVAKYSDVTLSAVQNIRREEFPDGLIIQHVKPRKAVPPPARTEEIQAASSSTEDRLNSHAKAINRNANIQAGQTSRIAALEKCVQELRDLIVARDATREDDIRKSVDRFLDAATAPA